MKQNREEREGQSLASALENTDTKGAPAWPARVKVISRVHPSASAPMLEGAQVPLARQDSKLSESANEKLRRAVADIGSWEHLC